MPVLQLSANDVLDFRQTLFCRWLPILLQLYSKFETVVPSMKMTVEEHIFSFSKLVYYWIITNRCVLWKAIGINSIKTKDFTECKFEATRNDLMTSSNKKGFFWFWLLWIFKSFPDVKIYIVWIYSQVKWFCFRFVFFFLQTGMMYKHGESL